MSVFSDIQNALNTALSEISGLPVIYYPNDLKSPVQDNSYIRPTLIPASSELYTLNEGDFHQGIYQVDVFVPLKKGIREVNQYADAIHDGFKRQTFNIGTTNVFIQQISISQQQRIEAWWSCYVEVSYLCVA